jgi:hypothetical protein
MKKLITILSVSFVIFSCDTPNSTPSANSFVGTWEIIDPLPGEIYTFTFTETECVYRYFFSGSDLSYSGTYDLWDSDTIILKDLWIPFNIIEHCCPVKSG